MFDRLEDRNVRRASRKARLDPMVGEDSADEEGYNSTLEDAIEPSSASLVERTVRPGTPDFDDDAVTAIDGRTTSVTPAPVSVGSALRRNTNGSVATPKVLPKRNKGSKVRETTLQLTLG